MARCRLVTVLALMSMVCSKASSAEPGGFPAGEELMTPINNAHQNDAARNGKCKVFVPTGVLRMTEVFARAFAVSEFRVAWGWAPQKCKDGEFAQEKGKAAKIVFFMKGPPVPDDFKISRDPLVVEINGSISDGRFTGAGGLEITVRKDTKRQVLSEAWIKATNFGADWHTRRMAPLYFRDGQIFLREADYQRPQREAAAKRKAEETRVASLKEKRAAAMQGLDCSAVDALDRDLGTSGGRDACLKAVEQRRLDDLAAAERNQKEAQRKALADRRDAALKAQQCEEVKSLDDQIGADAKIDECRFEVLRKSGSARDLFVGAGKYEAKAERSKAKLLYLEILERFAQDDLALEATKRLGALSDTEAAQAAAQSAAQAQRPAETKNDSNRKSARFWDCSIKIYGPDIYGIRVSIFGGGTLKGEATAEMEGGSRTEAEESAAKTAFDYRGTKVCAVGGIKDNSCKLWQEGRPSCRAQ